MSTTIHHIMESPKLQVAICGAGIAGLSLAISIQRRCPNIKCTLYEARSNYGEIGAGVGFGPNSVTAMYLIDPAIKAGYDKIRTRNGIPEKENVWYDFRWGQGSEENKLIGVVKSEEGYTHGNCSRSQFLDELVKLVAPGSAVFDKKIVGVIDDKEKGKTILSFQDGTHVEADAVIGCDGVKSNCRKILLGPSSIEATPTFSGKFAYRKVVDMKKAISVAGEDVKNRQMYLGQGGHVLTFPIRHGQMLNIVAFTSQTDGVWNDRQWVLPSTTESMQQQFSGWGSQVSKVLSVSDPSSNDNPNSQVYDSNASEYSS
jgi:salicylate hydroxylase